MTKTPKNRTEQNYEWLFHFRKFHPRLMVLEMPQKYSGHYQKKKKKKK